MRSRVLTPERKAVNKYSTKYAILKEYQNELVRVIRRFLKPERKAAQGLLEALKLVRQDPITEHWRIKEELDEAINNYEEVRQCSTR